MTKPATCLYVTGEGVVWDLPVHQLSITRLKFAFHVKNGPLVAHLALREGSDQTGRMPGLM